MLANCPLNYTASNSKRYSYVSNVMAAQYVELSVELPIDIRLNVMSRHLKSEI
jgi:hypothetical protein